VSTGKVDESEPFRATSDRIESIWRPEIQRLHIPSIGRSEGEFLASLTAATGARRVLELGTAIGYSAAYIATAIGPTGQVTAVDLNPERAAVARKLWGQAGLTDRITLHEGDAMIFVSTVGTEFDLIFVDLLWELGEQSLGREFARRATAALRPGGTLVADNCGQHAPAASGLMGAIAAGDYRTSALLPLGDGLFVAVKR
jgi:O-methyltransferase